VCGDPADTGVRHLQSREPEFTGQNGDDTLSDVDGIDTLKGSGGADHITLRDGAGGDGGCPA
jgi:Ca2+-binding RTX toxin-like protein